MSHCDPTTLALAALGEDIPADERAHLDSCESCLAEAAELAEIVTVGREAPLELTKPPAHVWEGITRELALDRAPDGDDRISGVVTLPAPAAPADDQPATTPAAVVPLAPRRGRSFGIAALAASIGALLGGSVVWAAIDSSTDDPGSSSDQLIAQAVLDPLDSAVTAPGEARVVDSPDGQVVRVDATSLPPNDGFYEVWLLDADATKLVALGALPAGAVGTFTVPPGLSIADFPVVDISLEAYDGDPGHSKQSLMRGILEA